MSTELEFGTLGEILASIPVDDAPVREREVTVTILETDEPSGCRVDALVSLTYSAPVSGDVVGELLESALEHAREEGMLSDPEWLNDPSTEELSCDAISCRIL